MFYYKTKTILQIPFYHLIVEIILVLFILKILLSKSTGSPDDKQPLTEKEKEQLIAEWVPEPLVPADAIDNVPPINIVERSVFCFYYYQILH